MIHSKLISTKLRYYSDNFGRVLKCYHHIITLFSGGLKHFGIIYKDSNSRVILYLTSPPNVLFRGP